MCKLLRFAMILLLLGVAPEDALQVELVALSEQARSGAVIGENVSAEFQKLLERYSEPEDRGRIYAELVKVLSQFGSKQAASIVQYGEEALDCPLSPPDRMRTYLYLHSAMRLLESDTVDAVESEKDCTTIVGLLKALRVAVEEEVPDSLPESVFVKCNLV